MYDVVELVRALIEREVRRPRRTRGIAGLAYCREGRGSEGPATALLLAASAAGWAWNIIAFTMNGARQPQKCWNYRGRVGANE